MVPSSGKEQQCGSDAKLSRPRVVDTHTCVQRAHKGMSQRTGRSIRDQRCKELTPLLDGFSTMEAFLGPKAQSLLKNGLKPGSLSSKGWELHFRLQSS